MLPSTIYCDDAQTTKTDKHLQYSRRYIYWEKLSRHPQLAKWVFIIGKHLFIWCFTVSTKFAPHPTITKSNTEIVQNTTQISSTGWLSLATMFIISAFSQAGKQDIFLSIKNNLFLEGVLTQDYWNDPTYPTRTKHTKRVIICELRSSILSPSLTLSHLL